MKSILKCDLHIHSQFSDGKLSVRQIVDLYGMRGFGAIAITDHLCEKENLVGKVSHGLNYSLSEDSFKVYMETLKSEAERAWVEYKMLLIPGYEITKNSFINHRSAHILVLGIDSYIQPDLSVDEILNEAKARGALTIAAHPFYTGDFEFQTFQLWSRKEELKNKIDLWEVNYRKNICAEVLHSGLPLIASSDFHNMNHINSWKTKVYSEKNKEGLFEALRQQKIDFFLDKLDEQTTHPLP